jgi:hypothetical protein
MANKATTAALLAALMIVAGAARPQVPAAIPSAPPNCNAVCMVVLLQKQKVQARAAKGKAAWVPFWFASEGRGHLFLPGGAVYSFLTGEARIANKPAPRSALSAPARKMIEEWETAAGIAFDYHSRGILTFRQYPCQWDCEGHRAGHSFAEDRRIDSYADCPRKPEDGSFYEGCLAFVADKRGDVFPP